MAPPRAGGSTVDGLGAKLQRWPWAAAPRSSRTLPLRCTVRGSTERAYLTPTNGSTPGHRASVKSPVKPDKVPLSQRLPS